MLSHGGSNTKIFANYRSQDTFCHVTYKLVENLDKLKTRMKTSKSSKALYHQRQTDGQNIYRIDAHL